jgi:hypothetical protein
MPSFKILIENNKGDKETITIKGENPSEVKEKAKKIEGVTNVMVLCKDFEKNTTLGVVSHHGV